MIRTFLCLLALLSGICTGHSARQPGIVLILIDDLGWSDLGCFGGHGSQTPVIDRLAREGIRFTQFRVNSPICSPSRCSIVTGQYPQRWHITSYLSNRSDNHRRNLANWLDPSAPSLARILQQHGYATGHFGKWHLGGQRDVADAPPISAYGFNQSLTNFEGMGPKLLPLTRRPGDPATGKIWQDAERLGGPVQWCLRPEITGAFADAAIQFIDKASAAGQPFFVHLWPDDVHSPFWPPVTDWREGKRARYLSVLRNMDRQLGKLIDHLRGKPALLRETMVLLCSDNGPEPGAGSATPLRGSKTTLYEGGIRSPLVAWGPGLIPAAAVGTTNSQTPIAGFDLAPSLLAIAGAPIPSGTAFDGENLSAALLGAAQPGRNAPIHWSRPPDRKSWPPMITDPQPDLATLDGEWKLLCGYDGSDPRLHHLPTDPGEARNAAASQPEITRRLTAALLAWHRSMPAPLPTENPGKPR
jgi:uncharacterized sulfatase